MICLRCGYCCTHLSVAIVNPRSVLSDGTIDANDPEAVIIKRAGECCPHLIFSDEKAVCTIHHLPCYSESPCDQFEQFGPNDAVCTLGNYFKTAGQKTAGQV